MNDVPDLLAALQQRRRDIELDVTAAKARQAEVQDLIDMLEHPQRRRGRPRKPELVEPIIHPSLDIEGGIHGPDQGDAA